MALASAHSRRRVAGQERVDDVVRAARRSDYINRMTCSFRHISQLLRIIHQHEIMHMIVWEKLSVRNSSGIAFKDEHEPKVRLEITSCTICMFKI